MSLRYLFGPVDASFADQYLGRPRQAGECLAFGPGSNLDLTIGSSDRWDDISRRILPK